MGGGGGSSEIFQSGVSGYFRGLLGLRRLPGEFHEGYRGIPEAFKAFKGVSMHFWRFQRMFRGLRRYSDEFHGGFGGFQRRFKLCQGVSMCLKTFEEV